MLLWGFDDQKFSGIIARLDDELQICRSLSGTVSGLISFPPDGGEGRTSSSRLVPQKTGTGRVSSGDKITITIPRVGQSDCATHRIHWHSCTLFRAPPSKAGSVPSNGARARRNLYMIFILTTKMAIFFVLYTYFGFKFVSCELSQRARALLKWCTHVHHEARW